MYRRTAQRGIAALAFVLMLTLAGAQPAAAADQGFLDRLAGLWGAVTGTSAPQAPSLWDTVTGWFGFTEKTYYCPPDGSDPNCERGWGIDPNGNRLMTITPPSSGGGL
jgi:hypothetical protein